MYRDHWNNVPEPDVIPLNISNDPQPLIVPVSNKKVSTVNDYFYGPNAESEGENVNFVTRDQPQEVSPPPDTHPPVIGEVSIRLPESRGL